MEFLRRTRAKFRALCKKFRFAWNPNRFLPTPLTPFPLAYRGILGIGGTSRGNTQPPKFLLEDFMSQSKLFVRRVTAFLLLSAAFLAQCALLSHFQKNSQAASSGQPCILVADGTEPPPPPTKLPQQ